MFQINAAQRLIASKISTTNAKFAYTELYVGEGFNKGVKSSAEESYMDGVSVQVRGPTAKKAVDAWTAKAKRLCSNFKAANPEFASGTWHDPLSKCTWKVEITSTSDTTAALRLRNTSQTQEKLRYEESD